MVKAVITQPTYLPWMGYFGMIDAADIFVFFDDVQFVSRSWQCRNKIKTFDGAMWLSVPAAKESGQKIHEVKINNKLRWQDQHWKSIKHHYTKTPHFKKYESFFKEVYAQEWKSLSELNIAIIKRMAEILKLNVKFVNASELNAEGAKTDRLISVLQKIGADEYIANPASKCYIEPEKFEKAGISLYWYEFEHPSYQQQFGKFRSHLSAIDLLFNCGDKSIDLIREGGKNALVKNEGIKVIK